MLRKMIQKLRVSSHKVQLVWCRLNVRLGCIERVGGEQFGKSMNSVKRMVSRHRSAIPPL